jgi:NADH-quinone oxidoreductase subunit N
VVLGLLFLLSLLLRLGAGKRRPVNVAALALMTALASLALSLDQAYFHQFLPSVSDQGPQLMFGKDQTSGLLVSDAFTANLRVFLYAFAALLVALSMTTGIPDRDDAPDFYVLVLGATIGMVLMASSVHLLMVFIAIEMASLPSYALAGFRKGQRQASEAALKYVVYGGGAAGIMLYGISLLVGTFGTGYLPEVALGVVSSFREGASVSPVVILGLVFILIGVAFKLAAVPFHFWCPDVFEGATAEVAGFLSVASKAAALALLARLTMLFGGLDPLVGSADAVRDLPWKTVAQYLIPALAFFAALTATFGNLAAYAQTNLKRLLAYSTIAHAGYMMMGLATLSRPGVEAVLVYLVAYLFMNLGAFAVVAFLRNLTRSEDLADFRGLVRRAPVMVITLCFFLLSLLGIPPLVGFIGKFQVFSVLWDEGRAMYQSDEPGLGAVLIGLLVVGGLNTVISAFYYVRVMKVMILDRQAEDIEGKEVAPLAEPVPMQAYAMLFAAAVLVLGVLWQPLEASSARGVARFRLQPDADLALTAQVDPYANAPGGGPMGGKGKAGKGGKGKAGKGKGGKGGKGKGGKKGGMGKKAPLEE